MSTILDALKKSERERTVLRGLGFSDAGWRPARDIDWPRWMIVSGVVAAALVATAVFFFYVGMGSTKLTSASAPGQTPLPNVASPRPVESNAESARTESNAGMDIHTAEDVVVDPVPPADGKIEFLSAMPPEFQQAVPSMTVNIHVYAADEASRILYINNRLYRRGDEISGGVRVKEIVPDGVVLRFHGQLFKLARPS
jgi:hypothetical protein